MEDGPFPCRYATDYEINRGLHFTWNDSKVCAVCRGVLDRFLSSNHFNDEPEDIEA